MPEYAGIGSRMVAIIIDHIILAIVAIIIAIPLGASAMLFSMTPNPASFMGFAAAMGAFVAIVLIVWILYFTYFESTTGQTLGKKLVNIKVTGENGKPLTFSSSLLRTILRIIDGLPVLYFIGFIVVLVSEKKQRIGDIAAKSVVVKA